MRRWICLLEDFQRLQIKKLVVADILEHQRLGAVADHNPFAVADDQAGHENLLRTQPEDTENRGTRGAMDQTGWEADGFLRNSPGRPRESRDQALMCLASNWGSRLRGNEQNAYSL